MASKNQANLESQKLMPPAAVAVASAPATAALPASGGSVECLGSVVVGISDGHHTPLETQPLLVQSGDGEVTTQLEGAMAKAFRSTADLAKHLPTGDVLVFEVMSPVFTNGGKCDDVNRVITSWLVGLCAAACFFLCFTDSFVDAKGTVRYVLATRTGVWVIDGTPPPSPEEAAKKRVKFIDFLHAFLSLIVFMSVAMFDRNVGACFNPVMSYDTQQVLTAVPLAGGFVGMCTSPLSRRHGAGSGSRLPQSEINQFLL